MELWLVICIGLVTGSFLNVLIYRLPRGESVVRPASACPACQKPIPWFGLIPIVGYLILRGKCLYCKDFISIGYPLVELFTAAAFAMIYSCLGLNWFFLYWVLLFCILLTAAMIDLKHLIIPDALIIWGIGGVVLLKFISHQVDWLQAIGGFMGGGGILWLVAVLSKGGMGGGDIKLAALIGLFVGWPAVTGVLFIASVTGALWGVILIMLKMHKQNQPIPFGPFLALGALVPWLEWWQSWRELVTVFTP